MVAAAAAAATTATAFEDAAVVARSLDNNEEELIDDSSGRYEALVRRVPAGRRYKPHDPVDVVVNIVGPLNNPSEKYRYYSLPFCKEAANDVERPDRIGGSSIEQTLGEMMVGDRRETSPYQLKFLDNVERRLLCETELNEKSLVMFKEAVHNNFYFEMLLDNDIPMWGYIGDFLDEDLITGEIGDPKTFIFPHLHFDVGYDTNYNQIVAARVTTDMDLRVDITNVKVPTRVNFSYSVEFYVEPVMTWSGRMSRYAESSIVPSSLDAHWMSVLFMLGLVFLCSAHFYRILKDDLSDHTETDEDDANHEEQEQAEALVVGSRGWRSIRDDVFLHSAFVPEYPEWFCAAVGAGNQLILLTAAHLILAMSRIIPSPLERRGSIQEGIVILYCLTSPIAGYVSVCTHREMIMTVTKNDVGGSEDDDRLSCKVSATIAAGLFPVPTFVVSFVWINSIALCYGSTTALPIKAALTIIFMYILVSVPFTFLGAYIAARNSTDANKNNHEGQGDKNDDNNDGKEQKGFDAVATQEIMNTATTETTSTTMASTVSRPVAPARRSLARNDGVARWLGRRIVQVVVATLAPFLALCSEMQYILASMWGHQHYTMVGILFLHFVLLMGLSSVITIALLYYQLCQGDHRHWRWITFFNGGMTGVAILSYSVYYYYCQSGMIGFLQSSFYFGYMFVVSFAFFLMLGSAGSQFSVIFVNYIYSRIKS